MEPETTIRLTCTGLLIEARIGFERSRLSAARPAKRETCSSATRSGASSGSSASAESMIFRALRRPRMSTEPTSGSATLPPATITLRYFADSLSTSAEIAAFASASVESIVSLTYCVFSGFSAL